MDITFYQNITECITPFRIEGKNGTSIINIEITIQHSKYLTLKTLFALQCNDEKYCENYG